MIDDPPTLQSLLDSDTLEILAYCNACHHNRELSTAMLIGKFRPGALLPELVGRLKCTACGSLNVSPRPAYWDRNVPGQAKGWNVEG